MQENVNIDVLTNWVFMLRADVDGAVWLSDDDIEARFYEKLAHKSSRVVPAQNVAIPLLNSVAQRGVQGVVAVVRGIATPNDGKDIFRPSKADVASLLLMSKRGEGVIAEIGGNGWLSACDKEIGPIRDRLIHIASMIARIRQACGDEYPAMLRAERLYEIIEWDCMEISWSKIEGLISLECISQVRESCDADRTQHIQTLLRLCDGIDAIHMFAAATRFYRPRGLYPYQQIDAITFMAMLRAAFHPTDIETDELFWKMKKWERSNPRYPLLSRWRELDPLGVVWDQRYWEQDLSAMLQTLEAGAMLAILKMDLDNFKSVNERCGHTVGDQAIQLYCSVVQEVLGTVGEVYRRGGDEVIVLAPGLSEGTARELAEKTRSKIEATFSAWASEHDLEVGPTASIGMTLVSAEQAVADILYLVDSAQKHAKEQGKNRVVVLNERY